MLRFLIIVFVFLAILVIGVLFVVGTMVARAQRKEELSKPSPKVIDIQAIDVVLPDETKTNDPSVKP